MEEPPLFVFFIEIIVKVQNVRFYLLIYKFGFFLECVLGAIENLFHFLSFTI